MSRSSGRVKSSRANRTSKGAEKWLDVQEHKHGTAACIAYLKVLYSLRHTSVTCACWPSCSGFQHRRDNLAQESASACCLCILYGIACDYHPVPL